MEFLLIMLTNILTILIPAAIITAIAAGSEIKRSKKIERS
jgi:hypothetical protein